MNKRNKSKTVMDSSSSSQKGEDDQNEMKETAKERLPDLDVLLFLRQKRRPTVPRPFVYERTRSGRVLIFRFPSGSAIVYHPKL